MRGRGREEVLHHLMVLGLPEQPLAPGRDGDDAARQLPPAQRRARDGEVHVLVRRRRSRRRLRLGSSSLGGAEVDAVLRALRHTAAQAVAQVQPHARPGLEPLGKAVLDHAGGRQIHGAHAHQAAQLGGHVVPHLRVGRRGRVGREVLHEPRVLAVQDLQ